MKGLATRLAVKVGVRCGMPIAFFPRACLQHHVSVRSSQDRGGKNKLEHALSHGSGVSQA